MNRKMTAKAMTFFLALSLFLIPCLAAEFEVVPDTIGIGLQKNQDSVTFVSGEQERCVMYHLGNPWATNLTGWLAVEGNLSEYFVRNEPDSAFIPSGTFRYNSSCCLIPISICFQFPYVLERTLIDGRIFSRYTAQDSGGGSAVGSATGSSVAYSLNVYLDPAEQIIVEGGRAKCVDFYGAGEFCFRAPFFLFADRTEEIDVNGTMVTVAYSSNLMNIVIVFVTVAIVAYFVYDSFLKKKFNKKKSNTKKANTKKSNTKKASKKKK